MNTYFGFKAFSNSFGLGIFLPQLVTETIPFLDRFFLENLRKLTHLFSIDCGIVHRSERQPFFFFLFFFFFFLFFFFFFCFCLPFGAKRLPQRALCRACRTLGRRRALKMSSHHHSAHHYHHQYHSPHSHHRPVGSPGKNWTYLSHRGHI